MVEPLPPLPFQTGAAVAEVSFHNNVLGNFMVYED